MATGLSVETTPTLPDDFGGDTPVTYDLLNDAAVPEFEVKGYLDDYVKFVNADRVPDGSFLLADELTMDKFEVPATDHENYWYIYDREIISSEDDDTVYTYEGFGAVQKDFYDWNVDGLPTADELPLIPGAIVANGNFENYTRVGNGINVPKSNTQLVLDPGTYSIEKNGVVEFRRVTARQNYTLESGLLAIFRF